VVPRHRASRSRRGRPIIATMIIATLAVTFVGPSPAFAAGATLGVNLTETDGTAPFDAANGAGLDSSATNGIVRVNDTVTYNVEVSANSGDSANTTFVLALPKGEQLTAIPAYCIQPGSSLTPVNLAAPAVPLTPTSYLSLPQQTLTCNVGARTSGSTLSYPVVASVRSEVPNGTTLGPVTAAAHSDEVTTPVTSGPVSVSVSAKLKWDISKNGTAVQQNTGSVDGPNAVPCPWDSTVSCFLTQYPITMSAPTGGKGAAPAASPITLSDDLSPAALWPGLTPAQQAAINANPAKYGARLGSCKTTGALYNVPQWKIGYTPTGTATQSVRNSGSIACSQSAPGQPVGITITNTDTSLYTYPTTNQTINGGTGAAIPANQAYAISLGIFVYVPIATVADFGVSAGGVQSLATKNTLTNLHLTGLDGSVETSADQDTTNDYRTVTPTVRPPGTFDKYFVGVPGMANNTPASSYSKANWFQGPPGGSTQHSGSINVSPGQTVISELGIGGSDLSNATPFSSLACDAWDNTKLQLAAGNYPGGTSPQTAIGSNGAAAWIGGFNDATGGTWATTAAQLPPNQIQYSTGTGGSGAASQCNTGTWYDSPAAVPGNDPTLASQGIYTAVSRVRVWVALPPSTGTTGGGTTQVIALASIALRAVTDATPGEILPNWAGVLQSTHGIESQDTMLADSALHWITSTYNPADNSGNYGDRLTAAPAYARIAKLVKGPNDSAFSSTPPALTGGQSVQYQLSPSLTAAVTVPGLTQDVWIEDCLPKGLQFASATVTPTIVSVGSVPADAHYTCPNATDTYIRWDLGQQAPNATLAPVVLTATVSPLAADGVYTNNSQVWAQNDFSTAAQRQSSVQAQIVNPAGVKIDKTAMTPITQVNRAGQATTEMNKWLLSVANVNGPTTLTNPDVIDVLPKQGDAAGSSFHGTFTFTGATVQSGGSGVKILYTSSAGVNQDPNDTTNGASGSTAWCSAPSGGTVVIGSGTCPANAAAVTGLRIQRSGAFAPGDVISVEVDVTAMGNAAGDKYVNSGYGRVAGLTLPVGPVHTPETVVASSLGDRVWLDANANGLQDTGEASISNFPVSVSGTDDLGNAVSATTTTDANGAYHFANLRAGSYKVTFDPSALTAGEKFTLQGVGTDRTVDSDGDPTSGVTSAITVAANAVNNDIDQGVVPAFAAVTLHKVVVDSAPSTAGRATTFPVNVSCTAPGATTPVVTTVSLNKDGTPQTVSNLQVGSTCTVTETDRNGAASTIDPAGQFVVGADGVKVTVTNTYDVPTSTSPPSSTPPSTTPSTTPPSTTKNGSTTPVDTVDTGLARDHRSSSTLMIAGLGLLGVFLAGAAFLLVAMRRGRGKHQTA
jgi:hypothetical protein